MHKNKCKHTKYIIELFIVVFCKYLTSMYMTTKATMKSMNQFFKNIHDNVQDLNKSKVSAGLMIITLNIASRFVTIKLSKSMESYLKYTFSKQILIFAIAWMGTRDIYIALGDKFSDDSWVVRIYYKPFIQFIWYRWNDATY